ncbi:MAG TPA: hypothetical protein VFV99_15745 [Kofleriaceae bacterium]|nr:hypothetical protein [Kofleriaceae bacterium]
MAKRSPILGYNHNVRYRGLVFHVQTEDSGLLNPHLFTHLFHEGVIVSTRKLVYDAGSNEEAIKALMQAQHKAVMKDLRKGSFDDKIDQYLGGTPGLEPRASGDAKPIPRGERAKTEADPAVAKAALDRTASPIEIINEDLSEPIELPVKARADSADRTIPITAIEPPPPGAFDGPTDRTGIEHPPSRTKTAQKVSKSTDIARAPTQHAPRDSAPVIEISVDDGGRARGPHDTEVSETQPRTTTPSRPPSHGAATLPAMKPPSRPIAPPVVTRPPTQDRKRPDSDVVEVYSPPPPSVEPPPGERAERPGQYSMSRKEGAAPIREKTGRINQINPANNQQGQRSDRGSGQIPKVEQRQTQARAAQPPPVPSQARGHTPAAGNKAVQQPQRVQQTAPIANRTPSPATPASGSGVVMTRPAVIVGAPPKPQGQPQRVRKAREDEGRGFGQGLISEKSLDEVILAYLSEDAEDK